MSLDELDKLNLSDIESMGEDDHLAATDLADREDKIKPRSTSVTTTNSTPSTVFHSPVTPLTSLVPTIPLDSPDTQAPSTPSSAPTSNPRILSTSRSASRRTPHTSTPRVRTPITPGTRAGSSGDDQSTYMAKAFGMLSSDSDTCSELSDDQGKKKTSYRVSWY